MAVGPGPQRQGSAYITLLLISGLPTNHWLCLMAEVSEKEQGDLLLDPEAHGVDRPEFAVICDPLIWVLVLAGRPYLLPSAF